MPPGGEGNSQGKADAEASAGKATGPERSGRAGGAPIRRGPRPPGWPAWGLALVAGVTGGLLVLGAMLLLHAHAFRAAPAAPPRAPSSAAGESSAVAVFRRVAPSVVLVASRGSRETLLGPTPETEFGTGLIFDPRGYIVTNDHVVTGGQRLQVTLGDGRSFAAQLVGGDPSTDLAVLRIDAGRPLPAATFATGPVQPGETAIAIGNPLGPQLQQSVTVGVVSAVRPMLYGLLRNDPRVTRMIQTDVAINPGNSGGPLLNAAGRVIGITTVKLPQVMPGVAAAGLGFAIPAGTVRRVVADLVRFGYVKRAWFGVQLSASPAVAPSGGSQRLVVTAVLPGSPAARAGLHPGDQVVAWNGVAVRNDFALIEAIDAARPGSAVRWTVRRAAGVVTIAVTPETTPPPAPGAADGAAPG